MTVRDPQGPYLYEGCRDVLQARGEHPATAGITLGVTPALVSMGLEGFSFDPADDPDLVHQVPRRYVDWQLIGA